MSDHTFPTTADGSHGTVFCRTAAERPVHALLSVVIPCHNEEEVIEATHARLAEVLPARWQAVARLARVVPRPARDNIYRWIARNRISWFGRKEVCAINPKVSAVTYGPRGLLKRG